MSSAARSYADEDGVERATNRSGAPLATAVVCATCEWIYDGSKFHACTYCGDPHGFMVRDRIAPTPNSEIRARLTGNVKVKKWRTLRVVGPKGVLPK